MVILFFGKQRQFESYKKSVMKHCVLAGYPIDGNTNDRLWYNDVVIKWINPASDPKIALIGMRADRLVIEYPITEEWTTSLNLCLLVV